MLGKTIASIGGVIITTLIIIAFLWAGGSLDLSDAQQWLAGLGGWAPIIYMLLYLLAGLAFMPATPLTVVGGLLFGAWAGAIYALLAATSASGLAFLIARQLGGDWLQRRRGRWLQRVLRGVEAEGWRFVVFVRLVPVLPFSLVNYGLGLTRLSLPMYLLITALCMLPGTLAYAWLGATGATVMGGKGSIQLVLAGIGVLVALAILPRLIRRFWQEDEDLEL